MNTATFDGQAPLKILHVIPAMTAEAGGPPMVVAGLAAAMAERGHSVMVAAVEQVGRMPVHVNRAVRLRTFAPDVLPHGGRYARSRALDQWLKKNVRCFDLVHLHALWQFPTFAAARECRRSGVPYVVMPHGMLDRYCIGQHSSIVKRIYWRLREHGVHAGAAGLHCLNKAETRRAMPWVTEMPKFVAGNGIDRMQLERMPGRGTFRAEHPEFMGKKLALFLSRVHPKKGLDRLIPAWKDVVRAVPESVLMIAGTGEAAYVESLKRLAAANGLAEHVAFAGQVVGDEKWKLLVDSDVFVLPSHQEGFSMAITEALAAGCAPVVTEECNFDELEGGSAASGVIVRGGDMKAFAHEVAELLSPIGELRRARLGEAGRRLVGERFTWQRIAGDLEQVYQHVLTGGRLSASGAEVWRHGPERVRERIYEEAPGAFVGADSMARGDAGAAVFGGMGGLAMPVISAPRDPRRISTIT